MGDDRLVGPLDLNISGIDPGTLGLLGWIRVSVVCPECETVIALVRETENRGPILVALAERSPSLDPAAFEQLRQSVGRVPSEAPLAIWPLNEVRAEDRHAVVCPTKHARLAVTAGQLNAAVERAREKHRKVRVPAMRV